MSSSLLFVNDIKILIEILLRECVDASWDDIGLVYYLKLLDPILQSAQFLAAEKYRRDEILVMLQCIAHRASVKLKEAPEGSFSADDTITRSMLECSQSALLKHINVLD